MSRDDVAAANAAEVDRWEQAIVDELTRLFDRQEGVVLARLQGTKARKHTRHWEPAGERKIDPKYIADPGRWLLEAAAVAAPLLTRLFTSVYGRVSKKLRAAAPDAATPPVEGQGDPDTDDRMRDAIEQRVAMVARGVETARVEVEEFIAAQEDAGGTMAEIREALREFYRTRKPVWAQRIATMSAVGSVNSSGLMAAADAGSSAKQWVSSRDAKVRPTHVHADRQVRLLDEPFRLGGIPAHPRRSRLLFPGDASPTVPLDEVINCRCTLIFSPPKKRTPASDVAQKAYVRTPAGSDKYGLPVGARIVPDVVPTFSSRPSRASSPRPKAATSSSSAARPMRKRAARKVDGRAAEFAADDQALVAMIRQHAPGAVLEDGKFEVLAVRDGKGRVGGYVAWQTADGADGPKGTIITVSVHPALKGRRIGDQLVAAAVAEDADVKPTRASRPGSARTAPTGAASAAGTLQHPASPPPRAPRASAATIPDLTKPGDAAGTSGDFRKDAERIERLQKAYAKFSTTALFSRGGRFSRAREAEQQAIIDHFLNQPGVKADRKALVLGGLPGAGKTTTLNSVAGQSALGLDMSEYVTVNADEVKAEMIRRGMVPTYPGLTADESATLFHAESFEVAHSLMRQAARKGLNLVYDTSLKSTGQLGFVTAATGRAAPPKYEVTAVLVDVPVQVAKDRAKARYLAGDRYMPLSLIDSMKAYGGGRARSSLPAQNFDQIKRQVDQWFAFDNTGTAPTLTGQGGGRRGGNGS